MGVLLDRWVRREKRRIAREAWWKKHCPHWFITSEPRFVLNELDCHFYVLCHMCDSTEDIPNEMLKVKKNWK